MDVLTETQHRALAFVAAANSGGYAPTPAELENWLKRATPRRRGGIIGSGFADLVGLDAANMLYGPAESHANHMESLGWIRETRDGGAKLTNLGRALLQAADMEEESQGQVVILDNEGPLAYVSLISELSGIGDGLLIDPYLELEHLLDLEQHTSITRTLISDKHSKTQRGVQIKVFQEKRRDMGIDVRAIGGLHDRIVLAEDGRVWTLGMSLNGVSRQKSFTVLTPLPDRASRPLANWAETCWQDASPVSGTQEGTQE